MVEYCYVLEGILKVNLNEEGDTTTRGYSMDIEQDVIDPHLEVTESDSQVNVVRIVPN